MNRKLSLIALLFALLLLAGVLYLSRQKTLSELSAVQTAVTNREIQIFLSLTPHG